MGQFRADKGRQRTYAESDGWERRPGLPLSSNIGQGQTVTLTQSKSGPLIRDTLRGSPPGTTRDGTARFCWISKGTRRHSVPCRPLCHPGPATASAVQKKVCLSGATPEPRGRNGYWLRPLGRRIRQTIPEQGKTLRKSFRRLLLQASIGGAVRTVPGLPASTENHRDLAGWPLSLQGQN